MAGWTGLEPATFCVTGRRSNQLSYHPGIGKRAANVESEKCKSSVLLEHSLRYSLHSAIPWDSTRNCPRKTSTMTVIGLQQISQS